MSNAHLHFMFHADVMFVHSIIDFIIKTLLIIFFS